VVGHLIQGKETHSSLDTYAALTVMRSTPGMQPWMTISGMNVNNLQQQDNTNQENGKDEEDYL
jgi:hypothetical protein